MSSPPSGRVRLATRLAALAFALLWATPGPSDARAEESPAPPEASEFAVIEAGDTLSRLAARHGTTVKALEKLNRRQLKRSPLLQVGDRIRLRTASEARALAKRLAAEIREAPPEPPAPSATTFAFVGPPWPGPASKSPIEAPPPATPAEAPPAVATPAAPPPVPPTPTGPVWRDHILVRRGDTLRGLARREGVDVTSLLAWNGLSEDAVVRAGQRLTVERPGERPPARSIGRASDGRLAQGEWLGEGTGYRLRFPKNAYATASVNRRLRTCASFVHALMPWSADILIGDLSRPGGGRFPPHESHQSGRDADVGYYLAGNVQNATLHRVGREMLDPGKNWLHIRCLIAGGDAVRIYIDTALQRALVAWLRDHKVETPESIARLFETEGGASALIQHARHHDTHIHIRYACSPDHDAPIAPAPVAGSENASPDGAPTPSEGTNSPDRDACRLEPGEAPFVP